MDTACIPDWGPPALCERYRYMECKKATTITVGRHTYPKAHCTCGCSSLLLLVQRLSSLLSARSSYELGSLQDRTFIVVWEALANATPSSCHAYRDIVTRMFFLAST